MPFPSIGIGHHPALVAHPVLLIDDVATIYIKINCFDRLGSRFEARVTMVGRDAYGVAIHTESEAARLDWRRDYANIRYESFDPPADVLAGMRAYLDAMDLCYGCFDLVATAEGVLAYECNPAGQYLWLEHATGLPISAGIAALLARGVL
ncbi:MAG: hypothetical protein ACRDSR_00505 [Pseudonocardiaceae bacterium]